MSFAPPIGAWFYISNVIVLIVSILLILYSLRLQRYKLFCIYANYKRTNMNASLLVLMLFLFYILN